MEHSSKAVSSTTDGNHIGEYLRYFGALNHSIQCRCVPKLSAWVNYWLCRFYLPPLAYDTVSLAGDGSVTKWTSAPYPPIVDNTSREAYCRAAPVDIRIANAPRTFFVEPKG